MLTDSRSTTKSFSPFFKLPNFSFSHKLITSSFLSKKKLDKAHALA